MSDAVAATRRQQRRRDTEAEIRERAWEAMRASGPAALSLRDVARQMGMAPSAMYRYFPNRTELLESLVVEAFSSLGREVTGAYDRGTEQGLDAFETFVVIAHGYRDWALAHRA